MRSPVKQLVDGPLAIPGAPSTQRLTGVKQLVDGPLGIPGAFGSVSDSSHVHRGTPTRKEVAEMNERGQIGGLLFLSFITGDEVISR